jgi:hypothetical protein
MTSTDDSYDDRYRQYLQDIATDKNFDLMTVENWEEWMESETEQEKERLL